MINPNSFSLSNLVTFLMRTCFPFFFALTISNCSLSFLVLVEISVWSVSNFCSAASLESPSSMQYFQKVIWHPVLIRILRVPSSGCWISFQFSQCKHYRIVHRWSCTWSLYQSAFLIRLLSTSTLYLQINLSALVWKRATFPTVSNDFHSSCEKIAYCTCKKSENSAIYVITNLTYGVVSEISHLSAKFPLFLTCTIIYYTTIDQPNRFVSTHY